MRHSSETALAIITLIGSCLHFGLETYYHFVWGQPLQALIVDYIWNALAFLAVYRSLTIRPRSAAGLLAASWAYALGFGWRSVFGRLEHMQTGLPNDNGEPVFVVYIISGALIAVVIMLVWSLSLAWRESGQKP